MGLTPQEIDRVVRIALAEDVGSGDLTTNGIVPADATCRAEIVLKEPGVVCGADIAGAVFKTLGPIEFDILAHDGTVVTEPPRSLIGIEGEARAVLTGERVALNLVGRLSGIATLTRRYVEAVEGTRAVLLDTRKTTPGLRALEKYAVLCGGGRNHRAGLDDGILVKENHLRIADDMRSAVTALRESSPEVPIEVEAETLGDVRDALEVGVERILLDNMTPTEVALAVDFVDGKVELEASGGVTLENVRAYAEAGVQFISIGALTHSARSLDVSLELV